MDGIIGRLGKKTTVFTIDKTSIPAKIITGTLFMEVYKVFIRVCVKLGIWLQFNQLPFGRVIVYEDMERVSAWWNLLQFHACFPVR